MTRRKPSIRRLVEISLLIAGLVIVVLLIAMRTMESVLSGDVRDARAEKMPLDYTDLHLPSVPPQQNAATVYAYATTLRARILSENKFPKLPDHATHKQIDGRRAAFVQLLAPEFEALRGLDRATGCSFPHDWTIRGADSDRVTALSTLVSDLCFKAEVEDRSGDLERAFSSLQCADRIAADLEADSLARARNEEFNCRRSIHRESARLLLRHAQDPRVLDKLESAIRSEQSLPDPSRLLGAEIVQGREMIRSRKRFDMYMDIWSGDPEPSLFNPALPNGPILTNYLDLGLISFWDKGWKRLAVASRNWKQLRENLIALHANNKGLMANTNGWLLDRLWDATAYVPRLQADRRLLLTAIALFRMRLRSGVFPTVLPSLLRQPDPVDGKPLSYQRTARGFDLYNAQIDNPRLYQRYEAISFVGEECRTSTTWQSTSDPSAAANVVGFRDEVPEQPWPHFSFKFSPGVRKTTKKRS